MKKILFLLILVFILSLLIVAPASARKGKFNIKGEVTAVGTETITILSNKGEAYVVSIPEGFDLESVQVGDQVMVKAVAGENDTWLAQSIKQFTRESDDGSKMDADHAKGSKDNSAYCAEGKQVKPHPLAVKLAERYNVTEQWVMDYFCNGYGMGAIMLALKTSQMEGVLVDADSILAGRANGSGWGQIWKGLGLIGSEKNGHSPPGLLKKPDGHPGKKNK